MSQYKDTPIKEFYLDHWVNVPIPVSVNDRKITITSRYVKRPDLLSYDLYGSADYWWVFALRNKDVIFDPINDMKEGVEIFVVNASVIGGL